MRSTVARKTKNSTKPNVASKGPHLNTSRGRDGPAQGSDDLMQSVLGTVFTANKVRRSVLMNSDLRSTRMALWILFVIDELKKEKNDDYFLYSKI